MYQLGQLGFGQYHPAPCQSILDGTHPPIRALRISTQNEIPESILIKVAQALAQAGTIKELILSGNRAPKSCLTDVWVNILEIITNGAQSKVTLVSLGIEHYHIAVRLLRVRAASLEMIRCYSAVRLNLPSTVQSLALFGCYFAVPLGLPAGLKSLKLDVKTSLTRALPITPVPDQLENLDLECDDMQVVDWNYLIQLNLPALQELCLRKRKRTLTFGGFLLTFLFSKPSIRKLDLIGFPSTARFPSQKDLRLTGKGLGGYLATTRSHTKVSLRSFFVCAEDEWVDLMKGLQANSNLKRLVLSGLECKPNLDIGAPLQMLLRSRTNLVVLDLSAARIDIQALGTILEGIRLNSSLIELDVSYIKFDPLTMVQLCSLVKSHPSITRWKIGGLERDISALGWAIASNPRIEFVHLAVHHYGQIDPFVMSLQYHPTLNTLSFGGVNWTFERLDGLVCLLQNNPHLRRLYLGHNRGISTSQLVPLYRALIHNSTLFCLQVPDKQTEFNRLTHRNLNNYRQKARGLYDHLIPLAFALEDDVN